MSNFEAKFSNETINNSSKIKLKGKFVSMDAIEFKKELATHINQSDFVLYQVDIEQVTEMDLTALNALVMGARALQARNKKLQLATKGQSDFKRLAHLTKFESLFDIQD